MNKIPLVIFSTDWHLKKENIEQMEKFLLGAWKVLRKLGKHKLRTNSLMKEEITWTKSLPTEDGFYWYKEPKESSIIIWWDQEMQWITACGNDIAWGEDMMCKITGEFWPVKLTPPL